MSKLVEPVSTSPLGFRAGRPYNQPDLAALEDGARRLRILTTTPPQSQPDDLNQPQFDELLAWLDHDREKAGATYEWIRKRLIKIFVSRGSSTPEELADRTINRVAKKLPEIRANYVGNPAHYFSGVASNIFRESLRKEKAPVLMMPKTSQPDEDDERNYECLEKCMEKLAAGDRDLVLAYYQQEKQAKIDRRKRLAEQLGLGMNALRIRACRIRASLQECVERCATGKI
jgi:DNA-directed RNA polymerase specialized sigma24 family protein